jgi:hypothetical protein
MADFDVGHRVAFCGAPNFYRVVGDAKGVTRILIKHFYLLDAPHVRGMGAL